MVAPGLKGSEGFPGLYPVVRVIRSVELVLSIGKEPDYGYRRGYMLAPEHKGL